MISVTFWLPDDERDRLIADLWEAGTTGITEGPNSLRAFFGDRPAAESMLRRFSQFDPELVEEPDRDWVRQTLDAWQPFAVGERFYLVPEWRDDPAPPGRLRLTIHPGMACGTGAHPATQLCLEAMERFVRSRDTVLDVGTGTGILAGAGSLLGAGKVVGCDIDPDATPIAHHNWPALAFFTGSLQSVRSETAALIVANLSALILEEISGELRRCLQSDGVLVLSGFRADEAGAVLERIGFPEIERLTRDGWSCLVVTPSRKGGTFSPLA